MPSCYPIMIAILYTYPTCSHSCCFLHGYLHGVWRYYQTQPTVSIHYCRRRCFMNDFNCWCCIHGLALDEVLRALRDKPLELSIVVTGRNAPAELIELADTVTEMRQLKHAFEASLKPRRGVDF